jgi:regulator of sigma E protease
MVSVLAFVVVLGVLIVVHELGHFITAKASGIAVPRFSIGLGPRIWGFTIGETEYVISALPLGGYVKMVGMGEDEALENLEGGKADIDVPPERHFDQKSVGTRAIVIAAGPAMNFVFAIFAFAGVAYYLSYAPLIGSVEEGMPAAEAGVLPGDLIVAVDTVETRLWAEFAAYVRQRPGQTVALGIERDEQELRLTTLIAAIDTTVADTAGNDTTITFGRIGVSRDTVNVLRAYGLGESMMEGTRQTVNLGAAILNFVGELVTGKVSPRNLGGPILIGQVSGQAARAGVIALLGWMAFLSVNLAVLNMLPIPILDGGHLVFLAIEAVRGKPLSKRARERLSQLGFIVIMALMVWVFASDILRLTGK